MSAPPTAGTPQLIWQPRHSARRLPMFWRRHNDRLLSNSVPLLAVVGMTGAIVALGYAMNTWSYLIWGGFLVAPVLLLLSLPIARRAARADGDAIGRLVLAAAVVKVLVAPLLRYWMAFGLYGGTADAARYHAQGVALAPLFRHGIYAGLGDISGTRFMEILTGQVYVFTGPTRLGGFMVFSWFAFLGVYMFYRAFRIAYPDGDGRRYALLVFFCPTLIFWPSSTGKEAFMILVLGAAVLGAAQLLAGRFRGLVWLGLGLWGAAIVRPHMALIIGAGLVIAAPIALFRGDPDGRQQQRGRRGSAVLLLALLLSSPALIGVAQSFFGLKSLNAQSAQEQLDDVTRRSGEKGSTFKAVSPDDPVGFAVSGATVLFRPFPFESNNAQAMLTSVEGLFLLGLCVLSLRRLAGLPREIVRRPYSAFAVVYTLAFVYAFSSIANFGILARQRAQLLPVIFVVLCVPRATSRRGQRMPESVSASR